MDYYLLIKRISSIKGTEPGLDDLLLGFKVVVKF